MIRQFIEQLLGPYMGVALGAGAFVVWWLRASLGRGHLLFFILLTALTFFAIPVLVLVGISRNFNAAYEPLLWFGLYACAAIATAGASATSVATWVLVLRRPDPEA